MEKLAILTQFAAPHVVFGWFNLVWPNIAFWIAVIAVFFILAWVRIPSIMDADAESRRNRNGVDR